MKMQDIIDWLSIQHYFQGIKVINLYLSEIFKMGSQLLKLCNNDQSKIGGFDQNLTAMKQKQDLRIPERKMQIDQIYLNLLKEKNLEYSLEAKKKQFQPRNINIFGQEAVYIGWLKIDKPHGPGQIYFFNHSFLQAIFKEGEIDCQDAIYIENKNQYYRGGFKNSKQYGNGKLHSDGWTIVGTFVDGKLQGKGQKYFENKSTYKGSFKKGVIEGKGIMTWSDNSVYEGYFKQGKRDGLGQFKNNYYEYYGPFRQNLKEGKGTVIFKNGGKFQGWFQNDLINGYGQFHLANGKIQKGTFCNRSLI